jgi:cyclophilin family peptidyl-prolyl cis-trans isomerase
MLRQTKLAFSLGLICCSVVVLTAFGNAQTVIFDTSLGDIEVELAGNDAPATVANFLSYVNESAGSNYDGTFFHRSVNSPPHLSIIQGGGFYLPVNGNASSVPSKPPVVNEFGISNTRGTIAMAKTAVGPDTATNQWFFNTDDNSGDNASLDTQNGGFTVFGTVTAGMDVVDAIQSLTAFDLTGGNPSPFSSVPLINDTDFVVLNSITVVAAAMPGDVNLDSSVNFLDISPFISVLASGGYQAEADIDQSGAVAFLDITPFIALLSGQ